MWNHFMIKIEWLEELLQFVNEERIGTWKELFREMSLYSIDRNYAYMSFKSIRQAFIDFELLHPGEEDRIELIHKNKIDFKGYLENLVIRRSPELFDTTQSVIRDRGILDYEHWRSCTKNRNTPVTSKREFIQQLEFLQYLGLGVILDRYRFLFFQNINKTNTEPKELMKVILRYKDPRVLGYINSRHPEGDKLAVSLGKDFLTLISSGSELNYIDADAIFTSTGDLDVLELDAQLKQFNSTVYKENGFRDATDFDDMVCTMKYCFDLVFHGRSTISNDQLEIKRIDFLEKVLNKFNIKISHYKKKEFKSTYTAVSKLYFNSVFYNRFLLRPASIFSIKESFLNKDPGSLDVNLRLLKGNISLKAIFSSINTFYKLSSQLSERKQVENSKLLVKQIVGRTSSLLPEDLVERKTQLDRLEKIYFLRKNIKSGLMKFKKNFTQNNDFLLVKLSPFINFLNNERMNQNKVVKELENIRNFLFDVYSKNLLESGYQTKIERDHLNKFNLAQILNMIDDQKNRLERSRKMANNRELIELLRSLLEDTKNDLAPQTETFESQGNRLRFAIEKLVGQFKSFTQ